MEFPYFSQPSSEKKKWIGFSKIRIENCDEKQRDEKEKGENLET